MNNDVPAPVQGGPTGPVWSAEAGVPDAGSRRWALWASLASALLVGIVAVLQRLPEPPPPAPEPGSAAAVEASPEADLSGRLVVKAAHAMRSLSPGSSGALTENMDQLARSSGEPADWVRAAITAAEVLREGDDRSPGAAAALQRLDSAQKALDKLSHEADRQAIVDDISALREVYESTDAPALAEPSRAALIERYDYFGRLALSFHLPDADPARAPLVAGGLGILVLAAVFGGVVLTAGVTGLVLLVLGLIKVASPSFRPAFRPPATGGSVYVEAFAIFLIGFIALSFVGQAVSALAPKGATWVAPSLLLGHWLLALTPLWPLARGVTWARLRQDLGLHAGRGLLREIGSGVAAYLATLPVLALVVVVVMLLLFVTNQVMGTPGERPQNPLFERLASGDVAFLATLFFMATVWAPLVEEAVFRGCLFRHLSSRLAFVGAGAVSAFAFGLIHGVPLLLTLPLMTLGFSFAFMRWWRSSLVSAVTAHALHNASVLTFALSMVWLVRG